LFSNTHHTDTDTGTGTPLRKKLLPLFTYLCCFLASYYIAILFYIQNINAGDKMFGRIYAPLLTIVSIGFFVFAATKVSTYFLETERVSIESKVSDEDCDESLIEMTVMGPMTATPTLESGERESELYCAEVLKGRPDFTEILSEVNEHATVLLCGPTMMCNDVRGNLKHSGAAIVTEIFEW